MVGLLKIVNMGPLCSVVVKMFILLTQVLSGKTVKCPLYFYIEGPGRKRVENDTPGSGFNCS